MLSLAICVNKCLPHLGPCFPVCSISRWSRCLEGAPHTVYTLEEAKPCLETFPIIPLGSAQNSATIPTKWQLLMKQDDGLPPWCLQNTQT